MHELSGEEKAQLHRVMMQIRRTGYHRQIRLTGYYRQIRLTGYYRQILPTNELQ